MPLLLNRAFALLILFTTAFAASFCVAANSDSVRKIYVPSDFDQFAPRSALDLVQRIPGFTIRESEGDRGFGQADTNVLINGRRISGKSNGPKNALERLSVGSVTKIEVVDGASLDVGGMSGQVVNVITAQDTAVSGRYSYSPRIRPTGANSEERLREFTVALTGGSTLSEWTLSLANRQRAFGDSGPEIVRDDAGNIIDQRDEKARRFFDRPNVSGSFTTQTASGGMFNLVGEVNGYYSDETEDSERLQGTPDANTRALEKSEDEYNFEIGSDYEFPLGNARLKLIGLHRFESSPTVDTTNTSFIDGVAEGSIFSRQADEAESILRAEYSFNGLGSQWRWSVEGAENYLDIESTLDRLSAEGNPVPVDLSGASARVEETRAETTLNMTHRISEQITLQATIGAEYSEIVQTGNTDIARDFVRPKGFVSVNWKPAKSLFLSAKLERYVGQLQFFDFIASVDVNQDRKNVANVDLVPPQGWLLEFEAQRSLGEHGNLNMSLFYEDIEDIVDRIPISGGGQAPGNIPSAMRYGGFFEATLLSDKALWRGGRADLSVGYSNSEVSDPILGVTRRISGDFYKSYRVDLRQDFENTSWAVGGAINYDENSPDVRIDEVSFYNQTPQMVNFYIENKNVRGLTIRANFWNLLGAKNRFTRTVYEDRLAGSVLFSETRNRSFGYSYTLTIEGTF